MVPEFITNQNLQKFSNFLQIKTLDGAQYDKAIWNKIQMM